MYLPLFYTGGLDRMGIVIVFGFDHAIIVMEKGRKKMRIYLLATLYSLLSFACYFRNGVLRAYKSVPWTNNTVGWLFAFSVSSMD